MIRKFIPLNVHNFLDYLIGAVLIACPAIFGFSNIQAARDTFLVLGGGLIGYSLFTNYRYSLVKLIPLGAHMTLDVFAGVVLILAPWIFNYSGALTDFQLAVHWIFGGSAIALVIFTQPQTEAQRQQMETEAEAGGLRKVG